MGAWRSPAPGVRPVPGSRSRSARRRRSREVAPLLVWSAALLSATALFHALGRGALAAPSLLAPGTWLEWAATRDAVTVGFVVLRLLVLALAWYLVGVTTVGAVARVVRAARFVRLADALTVDSVRRLLQSALGLGLATAVVGAATVGPTLPPHPGPAGHARPGVVLAADHTGPVVASEPVPPGVEVPGDARSSSGRTPRSAADAGAGDDAEDVAAGEVETREATWEVRPGDHFWSVAEQVLERAWGRVPVEREIVDYWRQLVERNRAELVDPSDPDLIYPGQVLELPDPPPRPGDG